MDLVNLFTTFWSAKFYSRNNLLMDQETTEIICVDDIDISINRPKMDIKRYSVTGIIEQLRQGCEFWVTYNFDLKKQESYHKLLIHYKITKSLPKIKKENGKIQMRNGGFKIRLEENMNKLSEIRIVADLKSEEKLLATLTTNLEELLDQPTRKFEFKIFNIENFSADMEFYIQFKNEKKKFWADDYIFYSMENNCKFQNNNENFTANMEFYLQYMNEKKTFWTDDYICFSIKNNCEFQNYIEKYDREFQVEMDVFVNIFTSLFANLNLKIEGLRDTACSRKPI